MDTVLVSKEGYKFKEDFFRNFETDILLKKIKKNRRIIIVEEPLLVRIKIFQDKKVIIEDFVQEIIEKEFSRYNDLLFHYEVDKENNKMFLYAIKNGAAIDKVLTGANNVEVIPIQKIIKNIIDKKYKNLKNYIFIIEIKKLYYLINVKNNYIISADIKDNLNELLEMSYCCENIKDIIFDVNIKNNEIISRELYKLATFIDVGEKVNEKLLQKQRFYIPKFFKEYKKEKRKD